MDMTFKDYRRGAEIKLTLKDVPATMMPRAIDLFAMLLDEATEKQDAEPPVKFSGADLVRSILDAQAEADRKYYDTQNGGVMFNLARAQEEANAALAAEEAPAKKRGRPRKADAPSTAEVELTEEVKENVEAMAEQMHGAPAGEAPLSEPASVDTSDAGEKSGGSTDGTDTSGSTISTSSTVTTPASPSDEPLAKITDSELQRYSAKLAQHFGAPQKVFDIAAKFVPDGAVPRPTNIRDNGQRWAFVNAAHAETGLAFHG